MAEADKDKRVSLEGLAAVYDYVKDDLLGGLTFSITEAGLLHIGLKQAAESTVESISTEV